MAKRLLEYENEFIDINLIKTISRGSFYCNKENRMKWYFSINEKMPENPKNPIPVYKFSYNTEELMEEKLELLRIQLEGTEGFEFIIC